MRKTVIAASLATALGAVAGSAQAMTGIAIYVNGGGAGPTVEVSGAGVFGENPVPPGQQEGPQVESLGFGHMLIQNGMPLSSGSLGFDHDLPNSGNDDWQDDTTFNPWLLAQTYYQIQNTDHALSFETAIPVNTSYGGALGTNHFFSMENAVATTDGTDEFYAAISTFNLYFDPTLNGVDNTNGEGYGSFSGDDATVGGDGNQVLIATGTARIKRQDGQDPANTSDAQGTAAGVVAEGSANLEGSDVPNDGTYNEDGTNSNFAAGQVVTTWTTSGFNFTIEVDFTDVDEDWVVNADELEANNLIVDLRAQDVGGALAYNEINAASHILGEEVDMGSDDVNDLLCGLSSRCDMQFQITPQLLFDTPLGVPEPGTVAMIGLGLLGMGGAARRRRTRA